MEPLDPKAELLRLVHVYGQWKLARGGAISDEILAGLDDSWDALSAAITLALADARRLGMVDAAKMCDKMSEQYNGQGGCADVIRALIDGKAGGM